MVVSHLLSLPVETLRSKVLGPTETPVLQGRRQSQPPAPTDPRQVKETGRQHSERPGLPDRNTAVPLPRRTLRSPGQEPWAGARILASSAALPTTNSLCDLEQVSTFPELFPFEKIGEWGLDNTACILRTILALTFCYCPANPARPASWARSVEGTASQGNAVCIYLDAKIKENKNLF